MPYKQKVRGSSPRAPTAQTVRNQWFAAAGHCLILSQKRENVSLRMRRCSSSTTRRIWKKLAASVGW